MDIILTVFTPTFNRAYTLHKCYESLLRQTNKNFIWLIIDDGSNDHTKELVQSWMSENKIMIEYCYQENQGMHGAHNKAYELIHTELNVCIDSDDYMTDDAVEKIINFWEKNKDEKYAGIVALDATVKQEIIGKKLPSDKVSTTLSGYYFQGGSGDKKLIYRTEVIKKYPQYPVFEGEKYVGLNYKYMMVDQDYELLIMNEVVCIVEYMPDGSSMNMISQYRKNPKGFAELRKVYMKYAPNFRTRFKNAIHYVSSSTLAKNNRFIQEAPYKMHVVLAIPFGVILSVLIKNNKGSSLIKIK